MTQDPCRGCNDCCRDLAIFADAIDVQIEPRIEGAAQRDEIRNVYRLVPQFKGTAIILRCPFLRSWGCEIYDTRPRVCRAFQPGSQECTEARARGGKGPID